jgi:hypothetical protein
MPNLVQELRDKTVDLEEAVQSGNSETAAEIIEECRSILTAIEENLD